MQKFGAWALAHPERAATLSRALDTVYNQFDVRENAMPRVGWADLGSVETKEEQALQQQHAQAIVDLTDDFARSEFARAFANQPPSPLASENPYLLRGWVRVFSAYGGEGAAEAVRTILHAAENDEERVVFFAIASNFLAHGLALSVPAVREAEAQLGRAKVFKGSLPKLLLAIDDFNFDFPRAGQRVAPEWDKAAFVKNMTAAMAKKDGAVAFTVGHKQVSRAGFEAVFSVPGFRAEIKNEGDETTLVIVLRDSNGKAVAQIYRAFERAADGSLVFDRELFTVGAEARGLGVANAVDRQTIEFLRWATNGDPRTTITVLANISIGTYAWAKDFDFSSASTRDSMRARLRSWLEEMREDQPGVFTDARVDRLTDLSYHLEQPRDFAALQLLDESGNAIPVTVGLGRKELDLQDVSLGKAFLLTGAAAWEGQQKPFAEEK